MSTLPLGSYRVNQQLQFVVFWMRVWGKEPGMGGGIWNLVSVSIATYRSLRTGTAWLWIMMINMPSQLTGDQKGPGDTGFIEFHIKNNLSSDSFLTGVSLTCCPWKYICYENIYVSYTYNQSSMVGLFWTLYVCPNMNLMYWLRLLDSLCEYVSMLYCVIFLFLQVCLKLKCMDEIGCRWASWVVQPS